jgi:hypothetical protein
MEELDNYPEHISFNIDMNEPNEEIKICEGVFVLKNDEIEIDIKGKIVYKWFPEKGAEFIGSLISDSKAFFKRDKLGYFNFFYNGLNIGEFFITLTEITSKSKDISIKGVFTNNLFLGNKLIKVDKVFFEIPNFKNFSGDNVSFNNNNGFSNTRVSFQSENYSIDIDKALDYNKRLKKLEFKGGFLTLYSGVLKAKTGNISIEDSEKFFECFDLFITFLMGRRVSTTFHTGVLNEKEEWFDFSNKTNEIYAKPESWTLNYSIEGINELFKEFSILWEDENDKDFLRTVVHWYVEANNNSGYTEGSIIMAQTALELIYNWLLIEKKQLIMGNDAEKISASNKIRLLLSEIKIDKNIPDSLNNLKDLISSNNNYKNSDAPEIIVLIRNAIIHSQLKKRETLAKITVKAKAEALKLYIWYIELSILYILKYKGKYTNRCSNEPFPKDREANVPWV